MSDYTNKELLEAIYEVRDRVTRIEEKLNRAEKMEDKVELAIDKAQDAKDKAEDAMAIAKKNEEDIKAIKANNKWAWGFVITLAIGIISAYFGLK
jgi:cell division septum initiation protein DivIVA